MNEKKDSHNCSMCVSEQKLGNVTRRNSRSVVQHVIQATGWANKEILSRQESLSRQKSLFREEALANGRKYPRNDRTPMERSDTSKKDGDDNGTRGSRKRSLYPPLLALILFLTQLVSLMIIGQCIAGGKGTKNGRQGHIIVQNEVKSNPVPVYMPIPIPIPVPMGPSPGKHYHHRSPPMHHQNEHNDGEVEVKKIYLLQATPKVQSNLKGGGLIGAPVQNHFHLGGGHKFGHSAGLRHQLISDDQHHHYQHQTVEEQPARSSHSSVKSGGEVKILPIVMIPPIAPMPPIQVSGGSGHSSRMTLTPQFNNYVVAPGAPTERKSRNHLGLHGDHFSDYGGSLGAKMFREHYARSGSGWRARHGAAANRMSASELQANSNRARSARNFDYLDYGDYEYESAASRARQNMRPLSGRRYVGRRPSVNSIRDIMETHGSQQFDDEIDRDLAADQFAGSQEVGSLSDHARRYKPPDFGELSLDELSLLSEREQARLNAAGSVGTSQSANYAPSGQDLSLLSQEREQQQQQPPKRDINQRQGANLRQLYQRPMHDGSDIRDSHNILDDDEWRYESLKSVSHLAPALNGTNPLILTSQATNNNRTKVADGKPLDECIQAGNCTNFNPTTTTKRIKEFL